jgi:hypothetical protein
MVNVLRVAHRPVDAEAAAVGLAFILRICHARRIPSVTRPGPQSRYPRADGSCVARIGRAGTREPP